MRRLTGCHLFAAVHHSSIPHLLCLFATFPQEILAPTVTHIQADLA